MTTVLDVEQPSTESDPLTDRLEALRAIIEHAAHLLPAQGPITAFVHHNTLHAFEHLPFETAVVQAAKVFGCHPFLSEEHYRRELERDRIRESDLEAVLREDLGPAADDPLLGVTRLDLRMTMLRCPVRTAPAAELRWLVAEADALRRFRSAATPQMRSRMIQDTRRWVMREVRSKSAPRPGDACRPVWLPDLFREFGGAAEDRWSDEAWESFTLSTLWRLCVEGVRDVRSFAEPHIEPVRHRDVLLEAAGVDADLEVHETLIRFCAAFVDQGFAPWPLPGREFGLLDAFVELHSGGPSVSFNWMADVRRDLQDIRRQGRSPLESIDDSLRRLGVRDDERPDFIRATLLALRGWAGMIQQLETRSDRAARPLPRGSLVGFLAIRLLLDLHAARHLARSHLGRDVDLRTLRSELRLSLATASGPAAESRAFQMFQVAQFVGWKPAELAGLTKSDWSLLLQEVESFSSLARRRVMHLAFERRYRLRALDAISLRAAQKPAERVTPQFQAVFCIDEREESLRRSLEELCPSVETFSVAGFFGVAMYYRGAGDAHDIPLCPVIIRPQHWVREEVVESLEDEHRRRAQQRRLLGQASHHLHVGSRTFTVGALLTTLFGPLASVPLIARVLAPRLTGQLRRRAAQVVQPPPRTRLRLERRAEQPGPTGDHVGYSVEEMATIGERVLRDMGLTRHFARLIFLIGHGSNSLNNPHKAAYDCGACAGSAGGPNARALAKLLNDPGVRKRLAERDVPIPAETLFVGGWHNTCDDALQFFDTESIAPARRSELLDALSVLESACDQNAHERCRRFLSAPLDLTFEEARRHVQERAEDLAQTRPECGHATNALCIVARRSRTRGLFLDRRAFLQSYDPTRDSPDAPILTRILQAVIPVCAGINLEYYFSFVDPIGYGCGTKLPHNVASLLGVMDGPSSDLRTGLPWQMVEIHEPVRLSFVIETTPETLLRVLDANPALKQLCVHRWAYVSTLDPSSGRIHDYRDGRFEPYVPQSQELPAADTSAEWYRGWRDHLGFALIRDALHPVRPADIETDRRGA
ncbi:MAG: DUF2309 domain-containing protein [Planctomyces sp.]|nr:DUF2309 domain-containing protein [Planctomyces sp.]